MVGRSRDDMQFGLAHADITPPAGTRFGGFWLERPEPASGSHDPLLAQALVAVDPAGGAAAVISCDLQLISPPAVDEARKRIHEATGIPVEAILVHATHNHAAPGGDWAEAFVEGAGDYFAEPDISRLIVDGMVSAATDAWQNRFPGRILAAAGQLTGIGRSRTDPESPAASPAAMLLVEDGNGTVRGALAWYGCHPSILGPGNLLFSADYPGVVRHALQAAYPDAVPMFVNGPAGDISTRHTRRTQTFAEVERLGQDLAAELLDLAARVTTLGGTGIRGVMGTVQLPLALPPPALPERHAERLQRLPGPDVPCPIQAVRIGDLAMVGVGCELFQQPGIELLERSPFPLTLVAAPANGSVGNVPSRLYAEEAPALVISAAEHLMAEIKEAT